VPKPKHTYMRGKVPAENTGQCPCCLKRHRSTKRGTLTRHGWKETGRRVGQFGCGYQWGNCRGWGKRPLEQTDADALVILAELADHLEHARAQLAHHESDGEESYSWSHSERSDQFLNHQLDWVAAGTLEKLLKELGLAVETSESRQRRKGIRVYYVPVKVWQVEIPRGFEGTKITQDKLTGRELDRHYARIQVPSYAETRDEFVRELRRMIGRLESQVKAIEAAIKHHLENPSQGSADTKKRGPVTHWLQTIHRKDYRHSPPKPITQKRIACGSRAMRLLHSEDPSEVTCSRCLKRAGRKAVLAAEKAKAAARKEAEAKAAPKPAPEPKRPPRKTVKELRDELAKRREKAAARKAKAKPKSNSRIGHLMELIPDDATIEDW